MNRPMIIVHGGAGNWKEERLPAAIEHVTRAATIGMGLLSRGLHALDAAEAATAYMEGCGALNAGVGAVKNTDGQTELDAMIVDGVALRSGAVMAVTGIRHPISLARYVMERTPHSQFAGEGARRLYQTMVSEGYRKEVEPGVTALPSELSVGPCGVTDTVGCVVVDTEGRIACTSSTGGISGKMVGRVGDSPVFGAGAYADEYAGASATGQGEHIIRVLLTHTVVSLMRQGQDPWRATREGMRLLESKTGGMAGVIAADRDGEFGLYTNARAMPTVLIRGGQVKRFVYREEME
ncbi:MAG: isoaspartyl peptidase/L-asparaginase [Candidatus Thorarchaeota archaeon]